MEKLPEVQSLLTEAEQEPVRAQSQRGNGVRYAPVVGVLRDRGFNFIQITEWFAKRGVFLSKAGWISAWAVHRGVRPRSGGKK